MANSLSLQSGFWLPVASLWLREVVRFYRQPSRVIGGLASPLLFWILIGAGLGDSFHTPGGVEGMSYLEYFFPGTLALIVLFTAIFSTVSVIEDRREGFLQAVLVAPVPRSSVVLAKILGGATLASLQGLVFLALLPFTGIHPTIAGLLGTVAMLVVVSFALTGLGFLVAWPMESTQGFHSVMNLFLIPLWLLSGALFPRQGAATPIAWVIRLNPLSYGVEGLRAALGWGGPDGYGTLPVWLTGMAVMALFGLSTLALSVLIAARSG